MTTWAIRAAVLVLLAGTLVHHLYGYAHEDLSGHAAGSDDAYISYRYARSLAEGEGLVFNPGERVEGYSNLLYVLLLAPAFLLVRDSAIHPLAVALGAVFACAALVLFHGRLRARHGARVAGGAALALAASPALWLWNASGMETALVLLLQVALWAEATGDPGRPARRLAAVVVLLVLARADGFVGAALAVAYLALARDPRTRAAALALGGATAALTAWRLAYYGWPLPNTYYAKVSGPPAERIGDALRQLADLALLGLLPVLVVLTVAGAAALAKRRAAFEPFFALGWLAYWIYVGGDVFGERFLLVLLPLALAVLASAAAERRTLAAAGLAGIVLFQLAPLAADRRFRYAGPKHDRWVALGRALAAPDHRGKTLAVDAAGKVPFYSRLRTIDMLGLADAHIAHRPAATFSVGHSKHDADYVLAREPELIATWIDPALDLRWGLPRARYEAAGYRLRYLASVRRFPPADPGAIVDARALDPAAAADLVRRGWQYAVVEKPTGRPSPAPLPPPDAVPSRPTESPARRGSRGPRRAPRRRRPPSRG